METARDRHDVRPRQMGGERVIEFCFLRPPRALHNWLYSHTWNASTGVVGLWKIDAPQGGKQPTSKIHILFSPKAECGRKPPFCLEPTVSLYALHNVFVIVKFLLILFPNTVLYIAKLWP